MMRILIVCLIGVMDHTMLCMNQQEVLKVASIVKTGYNPFTYTNLKDSFGASTVQASIEEDWPADQYLSKRYKNWLNKIKPQEGNEEKNDHFFLSAWKNTEIANEEDMYFARYEHFRDICAMNNLDTKVKRALFRRYVMLHMANNKETSNKDHLGWEFLSRYCEADIKKRDAYRTSFLETIKNRSEQKTFSWRVGPAVISTLWYESIDGSGKTYGQLYREHQEKMKQKLRDTGLLITNQDSEEYNEGEPLPETIKGKQRRQVKRDWGIIKCASGTALLLGAAGGVYALHTFESTDSFGSYCFLTGIAGSTFVAFMSGLHFFYRGMLAWYWHTLDTYRQCLRDRYEARKDMHMQKYIDIVTSARLWLKEHEKEIIITPEIQALIDERTKACIEKDWALADQLRDKLQQMGIKVHDSPSTNEAVDMP